MDAKTEFGLLVIGDEMLSGKRADKHLAHVTELLRTRGMSLRWYRVAGDEPRSLCDTLRQTQEDMLPVLCFGGIGVTPDDNTRQAAAEAFGRPLRMHEEDVALIETQFGDEARPNRVRMAELPEDCLLIPNPVKCIPGFTIYDHHFLPGFPQTSWPMLDWVLDRYYPRAGAPSGYERSVRVFEAPWCATLDLMEQLAGAYPGARLFSLPRVGVYNSIEIVFRGERDSVDAATDSLVKALIRRRVLFEVQIAA
jgi:molybdopterin-biosynthesis enzyme MoeA-like protein